MNIAKIKDIALETSDILTEQQIALFNEKFRDRYVHVVNWTYAIPLEGTSLDEIVSLSQNLTYNDKVPSSTENEIATYDGEGTQVVQEIVDPWEICTALPENLSNCSFVLSWNNAASGVAMGQCDSAKQYLDTVEITESAGNLNDKYRYINVGSNAMVFTIEKRDSGYVITHQQKNASGDTVVHYLMNNSGNMVCSETFNANYGYWTFEFNGSSVQMHTNTGSKQYLAYNSLQPKIKGYNLSSTSGINFDLSLYKKEETFSKEEPDIYFENAEVTKYVNDKPFTITYKGVEVDGIYVSDDDSVAEVDNNGKVTVKSVGETKIIFMSEETDLYLSKTIEYTLKIVPFVPDPELYWTPDTPEMKDAIVDDKFAYLCRSAYDDFNGTITYESSSPKIASVDEEGNVTALSEGKTVITAKSSGTTDYKDSQISYTVVVKKNPVRRYEWIAYSDLVALDTIDVKETENINAIGKYEEYNKFSPSESDLTLEDVMKFRTWLAETLYTVLGSAADYEASEMLNYYRNEMYDDTIKHLEHFYIKTNNILSTTTKHSCSCQNTQSVTLDLSGSACDSVALYRKAMYNTMVNTFSDITFWTERESVLIEEIKKYVDYIIKKNLPLYSSQYVSDLYDCSCLNDANSQQERMIEILKNLSKAFGYIIEEKVTGNKNMIVDTLNQWATYLYEQMRWV